MREIIYNVFLFVKDETIYQIGAVRHSRKGTDEEKLKFLQSHVEKDWRKSTRYTLPDWCIVVQEGERTPRRLTFGTFQRLPILTRMQIIDHVFSDNPRNNNPLIVITPVVDGKVKVDTVVNLR